ncbi:MAG: putative membrane protein [Granulosicoccus sp.]|jgi:uncharacterized membrane protein
MQDYLGFTVVDGVAIVLFFAVWIGHFYLVNSSRIRVHTINYTMAAQREKWMLNVVTRGDSPIDAILQNGLQQGVLFFASTTVLLLGGLVAGLGAADTGVAVLSEIPASTTNTSFQWEVKLLLIMCIFVFAFFKFAWSYRLYNYILILIGGSPSSSNTDAEGLTNKSLTNYAKKLARLHTLAAKHFTTGLNAYFFALAAFTWMFNAWLFISTTLWVALVLYRRAFRSEFLKIVKMTEHD